MPARPRFLLRAALLAVLSFLVAVAVYQVAQGLLRRYALAEMSTCTERLHRLDAELSGTPRPAKDEREKKLAEMMALLEQTRQLAGELGVPSVLPVVLGVAAGLSLLSSGFLAAMHGVRMRLRAAALMDHAGARARDLADPKGFRFEEGRLVLTRPLARDSVDDLNDLRIAVARVIDGPGDSLVIDVRPVTSPTSQMFGLLAEAALEAREHGKSLRVLVSPEFAKLAETMGLDRVVELSTGEAT